MIFTLLDMTNLLPSPPRDCGLWLRVASPVLQNRLPVDPHQRADVVGADVDAPGLVFASLHLVPFRPLQKPQDLESWLGESLSCQGSR